MISNSASTVTTRLANFHMSRIVSGHRMHIDCHVKRQMKRHHSFSLIARFEFVPKVAIADRYDVIWLFDAFDKCGSIIGILFYDHKWSIESPLPNAPTSFSRIKKFEKLIFIVAILFLAVDRKLSDRYETVRMPIEHCLQH